MNRAIIFAAALLAGGVSAQAGLTVEFLLNGAPADFGFGPQLTIVDNVFPDLSPTPGVIVFQHISAAAELNLVVSQSNAPGTPEIAILEINSLSIDSLLDNMPLTVSFLTRDNTFTLPGAAGQQLFLDSRISGTFTRAVGGSMSFRSTADAFPVSTAPLFHTVASTFDVFSKANSALFHRAAPTFELSSLLDVVVPPRGQANLSGTTTVIPEPAALGLIAAGLPLLLRRRR